MPGHGPNGQPASTVEPLPGHGPNGQPAPFVEIKTSSNDADGPEIVKGQNDDNDIEALNRRDELLRELVEILNRPSTSEAEEARAAELAKELNEMLGLSDDDAETGGTPTPVNPGGNPSPVAPVPRRRAHQTRPSSPQPGGGTPGSPGRPGTPPIPPSSPGGPTGPEPGRPAPRTPDHNAGQPNPEKLPFFEDLDRYARLLAAEESKGGNRGIISRIWTSRENRRRAERLSYMRDVEDDLREQVMEHLAEKVNAKRQRGEYSGTDDEINQQMSDDMFDEQRRIFGMVQRKKNEALEEEAGKWYNRVLAKLGSFIAARGSKKKSGLKAGAVGFAHGAVKGTAVGVISGLFGAVWPISMAAGAVASLAGDAAIRRGVRLDAMQQRRKKRGIREVAGDDEFSQIKEAAGRIGGLQGQQHVADELFKRTRKATEKDRDKISREVEQRIKDNGVALALGRLAGGAVGGLGGRWVGQQLHDHTPVGQVVDRARRNVHEFFRGDTAAAAAAEQSQDDKINALTQQVNDLQERLEQAQAGAGSAGIDSSGSFSNWEYPWDWAVDQFGENNAVSKLYELADAAARDGHNIQWHGYGETQWLSIDGKSDTQSVLEILNKYNYGLAA
ncbi:hypothetical protein G1ANC_00615 [Candidatus Nanosynsacchari sp. TM7_ANC_38.39_G1_1]|nr:hypothetical protein G1ANC_00615 [Candidatus Nanosynsacchari sp. TM7_ANC_38.39_G1_1]